MLDVRSFSAKAKTFQINSRPFVVSEPQTSQHWWAYKDKLAGRMDYSAAA
jgi:hypothetical protein